MFLMPVEPFEPNKLCYVCSETPLFLEINAHRSKLRDIVEKIVKQRLGMNFPLIMHGSALLYDVGDDLEEDEIANYAANLDKVLSKLPSPVTGGTILTVEDLQQELKCRINVKHREEFDEEKEPDEMILSGWTQPPLEEKNETTAIDNGAITSGISLSSTMVAEENDLQIIPPQIGSKRKLFDISFDDHDTSDISIVTGATKFKRKAMEIVGDDDVVMLDDGNPDHIQKTGKQ